MTGCESARSAHGHYTAMDGWLWSSLQGYGTLRQHGGVRARRVIKKHALHWLRWRWFADVAEAFTRPERERGPCESCWAHQEVMCTAVARSMSGTPAEVIGLLRCSQRWEYGAPNSTGDLLEARRGCVVATACVRLQVMRKRCTGRLRNRCKSMG